MIHPFQALAPEYATLLSRMQITRLMEVERVAGDLLDTIYHFKDVSAQTGVPEVWGAASFEREASSDFRLSPAQGDPWNRVSVDVPRGRGPFKSWEAAAIDAYHLDALDKVGAGNWTWARACYEGELFNGFGYRAHGVHSPYLWAGSNVYDKGKFTSDGHFAPGVRDLQLGIIPLMVTMVELSPSLALADTLPILVRPAPVLPAPPVDPPMAPPIGVGGGPHDTKWLQTALNRLQAAGLLVDGSYGRNTRRAVVAFQAAHGLEPDGLAGPLTIAKIEGLLQEPTP